ncbi:hypothetical protein K227x_50630 [Rubripirellula lacrimiformis]|uniref:Uncharacterized protein n=1 Tax=Rubripirellula lacrimiformis TaxID=1930273 RepID=A0A517NHN1_9BACT|nr:hypothetical protein [Rubripirellula lacrimiformis]QDT06647.1 hypothetical protein K227x_50630 [Rubripirellula lacrimiformis]
MNRKLAVGFRVLCWTTILLAAVGCDDPVFRPVAWIPPTADWTLADSDDSSTYEWPMTNSGYQVNRPPQMAYVTSFDQKLTCPDPVTAELVPWPTEGKDQAMLTFLEKAYADPAPELDVLVELDKTQFLGPQAFDVSSDGSRMVLIDAQGLAMYKMDDGSLVGHLALPAVFAAGAAAPEAVRFCGNSKDMLVASADTIVRISSKDGSVIGQCDGVGDPIAQWFVNINDDTTLMRTESGQLFGGDSQLKTWNDYKLRNQAKVSAAALSDDGLKIAVAVNQVPRLYVQKDYQIVESVNDDGPESVRLDPNIDVAISGGQCVWADQDGIFQLYYQDGKLEPEKLLYHMFWQPHLLSPVKPDDESHTFLIAGTRFYQGAEQPILFFYNTRNRAHSPPKILKQIPTRIAHSRSGDRLAMLEAGQLKICQQVSWPKHGSGQVKWWAYWRTVEGKFDVLEELLAIIDTQHRLGYGRTSESLRSSLLAGIAYRVRELIESEPDGEAMKKFTAWKESGSTIALTADGIGNHDYAWQLRGSGFASSVTASGWEGFEKHIQSANKSLQLAIDSGEDLPLAALEAFLTCRLETDGSLDNIDAIARQATQRYPGELEPHLSIMFKLMPQWYGEEGDAASFAISVAKMLEQPYSDLLYLKLAAISASWRDASNRKFDSQRAARGLAEMVRQSAVHDNVLWDLWVDLFIDRSHATLMDATFVHLMETTAAVPQTLGNGHYRGIENNVHGVAQAIRKGEFRNSQ